MLTQAAIRSDAFRVVPDSRPVPPVRRSTGRGGDANSLDESLQLMGATMSYPRNTEIFGENEPADYVYKVVSGSVRTYNILSDGRRQIGGFYMPGDIFGIEFDGDHTSAAEAITDVKVLVVKRSALDALAGRDASVARELYRADGAGAAAGARPNPAAHQERARARRRISSRNGATRQFRQCHRSADVAAGHRRLSRPDH